MLRSIRGRLILSYVLLTLLTVGLVGGLTLALVQRRVQRQARAQLRENAEAVAQRAAPLIWPVPQLGELQELADTAAFIGDVRVRIWDGERRLLADSGLDDAGKTVLWVLPPAEWRLSVQSGDGEPVLLVMPGTRWRPWEDRQDPSDLVDDFTSQTAYTLVRRWEGIWGHRFMFESTPELTPVPDPTSRLVAWADLLSRDEWPYVERAPRSGDEVVVPIAGEGGAGHRGYVEMGGGPELNSSVLRTIGGAIWLAAAGTALLALVVGLVVSQGLSAPVRALTATADQMGQGDLSVRAPVRGRGEIAQLAGQFNQMAGRLEVSFADLASERDALRRFVADASHELRTPITALKSFIDLLQGPAAGDAQAQAEFLAESQVQIERLEWITRHLLDLSRLDAGLAALDLDAHDVGELIEASLALFKAQAREKRISLSWHAPQPALTLVCDRGRIEMALSNLVDNALKYTPAGGIVEVGATAAAETVRLWVRDTGPGIAAEDRERIFERFARGPAHSGSSDGTPCPRPAGSGLGLAIVKSVAQAHGGRAWVESAPGMGSLFLLELPLLPRSV